MAKLTIGDKTVTVDDSFRSLSPEQQNAAVEEIASSLGLGTASQTEEVGAPDPQIAAYTGEVLSGDPTRARAAVVQNEYEQMPWYQKPLQATDDIVRLTADGLTAGYVDKAAGALGGEGVDAERQKTEDARSRAGWAGTTAEVAGGIYGAGKVLKGGEAIAKAVPTVGRIANAVKTAGGVGGTAARTAATAAGGAAYGAVDAAGHDRDVLEGAELGALAGVGGKALGNVASKVGSKVAGTFNKAPKIMTREELAAAGRQAYKAADDAGVIVKPQATQRLSQELKEDLAEFGYMPELQPNVGKFLGALDRMADENITLKGLDNLRKTAGLMGKSADGAEREISRQIIKKIDKHLENLSANDVFPGGDRVGGLKALQAARKLWASTKKSEMIENAIEKAKNNAGAGGSGGNFDNSLRQQFRSILNDPKKSRGLTKDERAAMQLIVRGVRGESLLRAVGKMSPNGNGLMAALHGGLAVPSGGVSLLLAGAGAGAKTAVDKLTPARVEQLSRIVRAGGDASATKAQKNLAQKLIEQYGERLQLPLAVGGVLATD